jgi:glutathionylspermidine synthase
MQLHEIEPRADWENVVRDQGLVYAMTDHPDGSIRPYWNESVYYSFNTTEIDRLEAATNELHEMAVTAAGHVLGQAALAERMGIPAYALDRIRQSWNNDEPSLYGRFDLSYDETGGIKMLEYNADTPTSLVEAAVIQWLWKEDVKPDSDQWSS